MARSLELAAERIQGFDAGSPGLLPWIVALDADDINLAADLGASIGRVAPGSLRWLADAWDAAGQPG